MRVTIVWTALQSLQEHMVSTWIPVAISLALLAQAASQGQTARLRDGSLLNPLVADASQASQATTLSGWSHVFGLRSGEEILITVSNRSALSVVFLSADTSSVTIVSLADSRTPDLPAVPLRIDRDDVIEISHRVRTNRRGARVFGGAALAAARIALAFAQPPAFKDTYAL